MGKITTARWIKQKLILDYTLTKEDQQRRFRASEVVAQYPYQIETTPEQTLITFYSNTFVTLSHDGVNCTCPDFQFRRSPCKHIFAGAYLAGDTSSIVENLSQSEKKIELTTTEIIETPRSSSSNEAKLTPSSSKQNRNRPQDIRIGKYFLLSDFLYSASAAIEGIANCPKDLKGREVYCLQQLAKAILDPVVEEFGAISITFGLIAEELYQKKFANINGFEVHACQPVKRLKAKYASAADILVHSQRQTPRNVLNWIRDNCVYDRLILYQHSPIICVAWADQPRYDCKEWFLPDNLAKSIYIDAIRESRPSDGLTPELQNWLIEQEPDLGSDLFRKIQSSPILKQGELFD